MSVVFVGNIPYDYTEEQLTEIFKQIGPVKNFRLVFDKDNGRGKGYGFCEYLDAGNAQSAVRNLDGYDVGNRQLRVAFSDSDQNKLKTNTGPSSSIPPPQAIPPEFAQQFARGGSLPPPPPPTSSGNVLPPLPVGTQPPAGVSATDAISRTLSTMPTNQLLDVITQFKALVLSNPAQAEALLKQAPPLSYAVLQALLLMNLVDAQVLAGVISGGAAQAQAPPAVQQVQQQQYRNSPTPVPLQQAQFRNSPAPVAQQQAARQPSVMALSDAQINGLPQEQRNQILMIKQQVAAGLM
ncbi:Uncharacterized RNA-binding protein C644.16 [Taphrina deformans PYCC 5710]|uniref:Uncharacterized RNA-binding protein C644.16 n=1 Tax=Taphrina deformans (strain PYCC 5710 / ATCC 11124 / CBS 356.35 / IMI 108563 / JCM 9778 / NBRC 8474) TaxID=1097556 RepID=R4XFW4_TAPDE|nr:Uncharacterized RNA-binding protein C644.16 [Taphrina deformans PYCC 5710]|eukprot:CCG83384.1 Uncharacterized RNA-binding protein C644.16 [Taphrina deformans PYCC 5710]